MKSLYKWLLANKISLNCSKTELIFFHKPGKMPTDFKFKIKMNGHILIPSKFIKYLGIYLDSTLSGSHHCDLLARKLRRVNGLLSKIRHYVPLEELKSIYYAIFSSHMIYGSQIWGQSINIHTDKIFKLQNKAMRIIQFSDFGAYSNPIYKTNKILKLKDNIELHNCLFVHDFFHKKLPNCFETYFHPINEIHTIGTKRAELGCMFIPFLTTTTFGLNSITKKCMIAGTSLPTGFKHNLTTISHLALKTKIRAHFLNSY